MNLFVRPEFWASCGAIYLWMYVPTRWPRTLWFGLGNLVALSVLLGWEAGVLALCFAFILWAPMTLVERLRFRSAERRALEVASLVGVVLVAAFVLHKGMLESWAREWIGDNLSPAVWVLRQAGLLGFSYLFLRALDFLRAVRNGQRVLDPVSLCGYLTPFHMLLAGPVNVYAEHVRVNQEGSVAPSFSRLLRGANVITTGLFMKLFCAEGLRILYVGVEGQLSSETWMDTAYIFVYVYFDFAGYSLVAYGVGELCGIPTPRNFRAPFLSVNITEFWTRWHMSLGDFVRRNIFTPLQVSLVRRFGVARAPLCNLVTLILAFTFVGLWHRFALVFLLWGLAMGGILSLEKIARDRLLRLPRMRAAARSFWVRLVGPIYVFVVLVTSLHFVMKELLGG